MSARLRDEADMFGGAGRGAARKAGQALLVGGRDHPGGDGDHEEHPYHAGAIDKWEAQYGEAGTSTLTQDQVS